MKVEILYALPASGKTTYAAEQTKNKHYSDRTHHVDCDRILKSPHTNKDKSPALLIAEAVNSYDGYSSSHTVIVDGLITTNADANKVMSAIQTLTPRAKFVIVLWNEDREACLHNDRGRRELSSKDHIKNMPYETPSEELLATFGATVVRKTVERKAAWEVWADENGISRELSSSTWSLGGSYGNCWNDTMHHSSPDPQPTNFDEFDLVLEQICPTIGFMQYKKLYNACVTIETAGESGYYGSYSESAHFSCDVEKLYEMLIEMKILNESNT